jgi:hypothetical protein
MLNILLHFQNFWNEIKHQQQQDKMFCQFIQAVTGISMSHLFFKKKDNLLKYINICA